jgi:hypothetical protein
MREINVICKDTGEVITNYNDYLRSKHWRNLKTRYRNSGRPEVCGICGCGGKGLHFHHKSYKRLGREYITDVAIMCEKCHSYLHYLIRNAGNSRYNTWSLAKKLRKAAWKPSHPLSINRRPAQFKPVGAKP